MLGLNKCIQQDPQEFSKLFLAKLERMIPCFKDRSRLSFNELLSGQLQYVTRCSFCQNETLQSHSFHELDMSIEGYSSLEEAIEGYSATESLCNENQNQYECGICKCRRDAMRFTFIRKAPIVLSFHLLRYVYDRKTFERKKLQSSLAFPNVLEWKADVDLDATEPYKLVSVLYHKGQSAYGGHYVCDVLDWQTNAWFHCDDEKISPTENPTDSFLLRGSSVKNTSTVDSASYNQAKNGVIEIIDIDEEDKASKRKRKHNADSKLESVAKSISDKSAIGRDVCILNYVKMSEYNKGKSMIRCVHDIHIQDILKHNSSQILNDVDKYKSIKSKIETQISQRKDTYLRIQNDLTPNNKTAASNTTIPCINTTTPPGRFHLVPSDWLKQWIIGDPNTFQFINEVNSFSNRMIHSKNIGYNNDIIPPLESNPDNTSMTTIATFLNDEISTAEYICTHGFGMNTEALSSFKVLSDSAFANIFNNDFSTRERLSYNFNENNFRCDFCFNTLVESRQKTSDVVNKNSIILSLIDSSTDNNNVNGYWISKQWIQQLRKYTNTYLVKGLHFHFNDGKKDVQSNDKQQLVSANTKPYYPVDPYVNSVIYCDKHKMLSIKYHKKVARVNKKTWLAISQEYPHAIEIEEDAIPCIYCQQDEDKGIQMMKECKATKSKEIENNSLLQLSKMKCIYPEILDDLHYFENLDNTAISDSFYAIDGLWISHWRRYIKEPTFSNPGPLTNARLKCYCSSQPNAALITDVLAKISDGIHPMNYITKQLQVHNFGDHELGVANNDIDSVINLPIAELITAQQWYELLNIYAPSAFEKYNEDRSSSLSHLVEAEALTDTNVFAVQLLWNYDQKRWTWSPTVCIACTENVEMAKNKSLVNYADTTMKVCFVRNAENLQTVIEESGGSYLNTNSNNTDIATSSSSAAVGVIYDDDLTQTNRRSIPTRTTKRNGKHIVRANVKVDSSDTLALLKLKIYEAFSTIDLPPSSQHLFNNNGISITEGLTMTLNYCNIKADDVIYVIKKDIIVIDDDYQECYQAHISSVNIIPEQGFSGTNLT